MKTLYLTRGNNIVIDQENNKTDKLKSCRTAIDYMYLANEPMHIVYGYNGDDIELDVDTDDLIITFYENTFKHKIIVVKCKDWVENLREYEAAQQRMKEEWAESKCEGCSKQIEL